MGWREVGSEKQGLPAYRLTTPQLGAQWLDGYSKPRSSGRHPTCLSWPPQLWVLVQPQRALRRSGPFGGNQAGSGDTMLGMGQPSWEKQTFSPVIGIVLINTLILNKTLHIAIFEGNNLKVTSLQP